MKIYTSEKCVVIASNAIKLKGLKLFEFGAIMGEKSDVNMTKEVINL